MITGVGNGQFMRWGSEFPEPPEAFAYLSRTSLACRFAAQGWTLRWLGEIFRGFRFFSCNFYSPASSVVLGSSSPVVLRR